VTEARLGEVALQRSQLEDLMQSLSRSRDENLVVDIESAMRLAQQQAQLTGSVEPLLAALRTRGPAHCARRAAPPGPPAYAIVPRHGPHQGASVTDMPGLLARLDDLVRQADDLPVANARGSGRHGLARKHRSRRKHRPSGGQLQPVGVA
jgi:uroporphyrin-3 C-methyltransferase